MNLKHFLFSLLCTTLVFSCSKDDDTNVNPCNNVTCPTGFTATVVNELCECVDDGTSGTPTIDISGQVADGTTWTKGRPKMFRFIKDALFQVTHGGRRYHVWMGVLSFFMLVGAASLLRTVLSCVDSARFQEVMTSPPGCRNCDTVTRHQHSHNCCFYFHTSLLL